MLQSPEATQEDQEPRAPVFAPRELLKYDEEERKEIADMVCALYESGIAERTSREDDHLRYDQMYRGQVEEFAQRTPPWPGAANLHVQMPFWLVDSIDARVTHTIWSQNPLVVGHWENPEDQARAEKAAHLVEWHLQPKRMKARSMWARASKIRNIHGLSLTLITPATARYKYRILVPPDVSEDFRILPNGLPETDEETGQPVMVPQNPSVSVKESVRYQGPVMYPLEWDDVIYPIGCMNLQPKDESNPGGADYVQVRRAERLSLMKKYAEEMAEASGGLWHDPLYGYMFEGGVEGEARDFRWWEEQAPPNPAVTTARENTSREQQQNRMEGTSPSSGRARVENRPNPEYEILWHFGPWRLPGEDPDGEEEEMVFFVAKDVRVLLGAFRLSDFVWTGKRPLMEMHYKMVSNRIDSMGVCELVEHLSAELDTIHNMRLDVGFATNMPWAFVRAASSITPSEIMIKPLALIPVDDPSAVVYPQFQNVTSFYNQEEMLTLSLVERVMGVTDLFLGVSPTQGAAARHATGFMGTQQEAEARLSDVLSQDAESFSFLCNMIRDLELQYGPEERIFRLTGRLEDVRRRVSRDDLWFEGEYDLRLGANVGMFSQVARYQRAMQEYQVFVQNPIVAQDMSRLWELSAEVFRAAGRRQSEIDARLGPKDALPGGDPKTVDEAVQEIMAFKYGPGGFPQPHPNDDNGRFMREIVEFIQSDTFAAMGRPNMPGFVNYLNAQAQALQMKQQQQMAQQQAMMQQQQPGGPPQGPGAASPENRAAAQVQRVTGPQDFLSVYGAQTAGGGNGVPPAPPPMPGR